MKEQITPCLWFDNQAKEAGAFYCSQLKNAKIAAQSPIVTEIEVSGQHLTLLDGGPMFRPNASISLFYVCDTEEEINRIWEAFTKEGTILMPLDTYDWSERYGWVNDKYGVSWQFWLGKVEEVGRRITPSLLFTGKQYGRAEEALNHYSTIFKNPVSDGILYYGDNEAPEQAGKVKHAQIGFDGQKFMFMDSIQPHPFEFNEGVSFTVHCENQEEIDYYWAKLTESGEESMCGWCKDKFGVSWQVIPTILSKLMSDPAKAGKAAQAFMQMRKFDIEKLVQASIS
ncbi:VOC family protein [Fluviicola chungangensis]|uniref:VOC family protein n=1 Tax=Fluviicola chungangensis TaxID=2597671 RepID=A0A556N718_9FLAO|nr:VOC family protein [Fluviicola chungangensis]TSJ47976.1 VOC family protein [Fluviicola chungangensis]